MDITKGENFWATRVILADCRDVDAYGRGSALSRPLDAGQDRLIIRAGDAEPANISRGYLSKRTREQPGVGDVRAAEIA